MAVEMTRFEWRVAAGGHRVVTATPVGRDAAKPGRYIIHPDPDVDASGYPDSLIAPEVRASKDGSNVRTTHPLEGRLLFSTLARTEATESEILRFADRYGLLGTPAREVSKPSRHIVKASGAARTCYGEPIDYWQEAIRDMRQAVDLWSGVRASGRKRKDMLSPLIKWEGGDQVTLFADSAPHHIIANQRSAPADVWRSLRPGELTRPAWLALQYLINRWIGLHVPVAVCRELDGPGFRLAIQPDTLIDALWIQFGIAVEGKARFQACSACDEWFQIGRGNFQKSKTYCSDACRARAYRQRKGNG